MPFRSCPDIGWKSLALGVLALSLGWLLRGKWEVVGNLVVFLVVVYFFFWVLWWLLDRLDPQSAHWIEISDRFSYHNITGVPASGKAAADLGSSRREST